MITGPKYIIVLFELCFKTLGRLVTSRGHGRVTLEKEPLEKSPNLFQFIIDLLLLF